MLPAFGGGRGGPITGFGRGPMPVMSYPLRPIVAEDEDVCFCESFFPAGVTLISKLPSRQGHNGLSR
jgi:hypothetical protein